MKLKALGLFLAVRAFVLLGLASATAIKGESFTKVFSRWDALWYQRIAEHGYGFTKIASDGRHLSDYAFFPLYPALEHRVHQITRLAYIPSGVLLSSLAGIVAALFIFLLVREIKNEKVATIAVVMWAALPMGIVQSLAYSESLFTAFAAGALYLVIKKRFINAAFLTYGAGLTRPTGLAVAVAVSIPAAIYWWKNKNSIKALLAIFIAPLGWLSYILWVGHKTGSLFGYFTVTKSWGNNIDGGVTFIKWIGHQFTRGNVIAGLGIVIALGGLIALLIWSYRDHQPLPLLIYSTALVAISLTTSGYFGSKPRYLLPAITLLIAPAAWLCGMRRNLLIWGLGSLSLAATIYGGIWLSGSGPL